MNDEIQSQKIICRGGLNTNENYLELSDTKPGAAVTLINYESSLFGGYRRINGYSPLNSVEKSVNSSTHEDKILGLIVHSNSIFAARKKKSALTYDIFSNDADGWNVVTTGLTLSTGGVNKLRSDTITLGGVTYLCVVDGGNPAYLYDGTDWISLLYTNSGGSGSPGGNQLPVENPSIITIFKNHIFVGAGDLISHSAPSDPLTWTSAAGGGQIVPGFDVLQMKAFRDALYLFGQNQIKKIVVDSSASFVLEDVSTNVGCIAPDSVLEIAGNLIFLSPDGIRPIAGTDKIGDVELSLLSRDIQYLCTNLSNTFDMNLLNSVVIRGKTQFRYFFSDATSTAEVSRGIIGSLRNEGDQARWEFGELLGFKTSCTWSGYIGDTEYIIHGDFDGNVYRQEIGSNFDGSDITAIYSMPYLDFTIPSIRKTSRTLKSFFRTEGDLTMTIGIQYDWSSPFIINPSNYIEITQNTNSFYDAPESIYDNSSTVYGGPTQPIFTTNIQGSAKSVQITYFSKGDIAPYTIQGLIMEFTVRGRQ